MKIPLYHVFPSRFLREHHSMHQKAPGCVPEFHNTEFSLQKELPVPAAELSSIHPLSEVQSLYFHNRFLHFRRHWYKTEADH